MTDSLQVSDQQAAAVAVAPRVRALKAPGATSVASIRYVASHCAPPPTPTASMDRRSAATPSPCRNSTTRAVSAIYSPSDPVSRWPNNPRP